MMLDVNRINTYINEGSNAIAGWFSRIDMVMMAAAGVAQDQLGVRGDMLEVGVFNGKSLILLTHLARAGENVVGLDYFDDDTLECTQKNMVSWGADTANIKLVKTNSLDVTVERLQTIIGNGKSRIIHIDGGHEYYEVMHDLCLFAPAMHDKGLLIMDDVHDREYPGLNLAIEIFRSNTEVGEGLEPLMIGQNKLVFCNREHVGAYLSMLVTINPLRTNSRITHTPHGGILVPFSRFPMTPQELDEACLGGVASAHSFELDGIKRLARERGSVGMIKSMQRAGRSNKDLL